MAEIVYQIFIKHLNGETRCLRFGTPTISGSDLKQSLIRRSIGIPAPHCLRLVSGSHEISDATLLTASGPNNLFPSCALLLRLRGGKGGFGSLLRGAATKAGQKKTNNFDACRDMSGRRLRHVNAEKKLEEWKAEAEERKLEKIAEEFLKKKAKAARKDGSGGVAATEKYIEKYREDSAKSMEAVAASVRESFQLYENGKRKVLPAAGPAEKRLKIWLGKGKEIESDSDDDDENDEDENSVVLDDGNCSVQEKGEEGSPASASASAGQSDGESSGGGSMESNLEEENGSCNHLALELGESSESGDADADKDVECPIERGRGVSDKAALGLEKVSGSIAIIAEEGSGGSGINPDMESSAEPESGIRLSTAAQSTGISILEGPLNFDDFNSGEDMEVLGMERLKMELQANGLKCGGTLQERSARLFLLKTTPVEKLPKKLFAKPSK